MQWTAQRPLVFVGAGAVLAVCGFHLWITPSNPPGYHRDEASISYNAYSISRTLRDEDGNRLPLFFRSLDDYKSPLYPYLLAGVFRLTGPSSGVARATSAVLVLAAVFLLGLLARRLTGDDVVAVLVVLLAGLTPWLFELGRVALEAATQPLLVASALFLLRRSTERWRIGQGAATGALLGLLTYSYTGSRLLGPLLASALVVFAGRGRWKWLCAAWGTFAAFLVPLCVYGLRHPENLTARYEATTIARDGLSGARLVLQATANWFHDIDPWHWSVAGDPAPYVHNGGYGALLAAVVVLALAGIVLTLVRHRDDLWWRYVLLATLLVPIPAALTVDRHNALRLASLPVFLLVLAMPALAALVAAARREWAWRVVAGVLVLAVVVQFAQFLDSYRTRGPARVVLFEAGVKALLVRPFANDEPIYVDFDDRHAQTQLLWHSVERGVPRERIAILPDGGIPPLGATVFGRFQECDYVCEKFASWDGYWLARANGPRS